MTMRPRDVLDVIDALAQAGVAVWVDGGWGIDALLEEQTRKHDDLDVVAAVDHVPRLVVVLAKIGYTEIRTWPDSPEVFVLRAHDDRRVDVHPVRFDEEGNGAQKIEGGREWVFPADGFTGAGVIGGRHVRCLTPEVQVLCHAGYELDESDAHDMRALRDRFRVELSPEQQKAIAASGPHRPDVRHTHRSDGSSPGGTAIRPKQRFNVMVDARDGAGLATDLYVPGGEGPFPAVVGRTPYNKNQAAFAGLAEQVNAKGYALVVQDVRGRGDSDGTFEPYVNDGRDGYDTIEWVAEQAWCDGNVIYRGASYGARAGWMVALEHPPHLRAMVIVVSPSDPFVEFPTSATTPMMLSWYRLTDGRLVQNTGGVDWMKVYEHLPLVSMDEAAGFSSARWHEAMTHTCLDDHWLPRCYQNRYDEFDVPVMHISGWYDDEQIGTPLNYVGMTTRARTPEARAGQRMLMGPWGHGVNASSKLGEVDFGPSAMIDLEGYIANWLDAVLGRADTDVPRVRIFVMGPNEWRDETEWPLQRTRFTDYFLHSGGSANSRFGDGVLSTHRPESDEPSDEYTYDPARPVPFITEPTSSQLGGPDDYSAIEQRGDVLCYTTEALDRDLEVTGPVKLVLYASSSAVDTDFAAKLVDVHPNGFCQRLCDSIIRARYRNGPNKPQLMEPGTVYALEIDLWNTSQVFKAGHRIRLEVTSSAFPKYDRNLNTGEDIGTGVRMEVATNRVWHDAEHPSRLVLPVIPSSE